MENKYHWIKMEELLQPSTKSVSYKDMADGNFITNQKLLGIREILLLAKIRRMAMKHVDQMTGLFSP